MKVLVTGANGYIGRHVVKALLDKGTDVIACDIATNDVDERAERKTLNLFDVYFERDKAVRNNSLFIGEFKDLKIVGNKSSFTYMYGNNKYPFINTLYGSVGMNKNSKVEGIHYKNFFATTVLGPLLILNPYFTEYLIRLKDPKYKLLYQDDMIKSYESRLESLIDRKEYIL